MQSAVLQIVGGYPIWFSEMFDNGWTQRLNIYRNLFIIRLSHSGRRESQRIVVLRSAKFGGPGEKTRPKMGVQYPAICRHRELNPSRRGDEKETKPSAIQTT